MKITLFISSLKAGGAERVLSNLANHWAKKGNDVTIVTTWPIEKDFYSLDSRVKRFSLNGGGESASLNRAFFSNFTKLAKLRNFIKSENPDVVLAFLPDSSVLAILASCFLRKKIIVSERNNATRQSLPVAWKILRRTTYPLANATVFVSRGVEQDFNWIANTKRFVINNPVLHIDPSGYKTGHRKLQILSVGRLAPQKGHDLLIRSFSMISADFPEWSILIAGEGPEKENLERLVKELNLNERVIFYGLHNDPRELMLQSSLFILPSRYEGFPNALVEAMSCGMPVISFDCPHGPSDIIKNGEDGVLVPPENIEGLASAMKNLMADSLQRQNLGSAATGVCERFGVEAISAKWEDLMAQV